MDTRPTTERPTGVYLVTLYFVLAGFLESIQMYRDWEHPLSLNPFAAQSVWQLAIHTAVYLVGAYFIWHLASFGRLAALIYGYLMLPVYIVVLIDPADKVTTLLLLTSLFHILALIPTLFYLQPARQKKLFNVSLWDLLLSN